jgi:hypothetical protein
MEPRPVVCFTWILSEILCFLAIWESGAPELCRNLSPHLPHWPAKICSSIANKTQVE